MEGACVYKGCTGLNNGVNGELFTSLNRDTHTITVLLIEFSDWFVYSFWNIKIIITSNEVAETPI